MQLDLWTKIVFTVIALSLAVIAWKLPMSGTKLRASWGMRGNWFQSLLRFDRR